MIHRVRHVEFLGTCADPDIGATTEKFGRPRCYKHAVQLVLRDYPHLSDTFDLRLRNPWDYLTNLKKGDILHLIYSGNDYLFKLHRYEKI